VAGPVKLLAENAGVPVLQPEKVRRPEAVEEILALRPDIIIVASYGQILPEPLLQTPPGKALNLHPSLLPRYRGTSPIAAPILAGDPETGTTLMLMSPQMDAGPILGQTTLRIEPQETAGELAARLASESATLLLANLPRWLNGEIEPRPQDESHATYTQRIRKSDGAIDWRLSAKEIQRQVRAYAPWPGAYTAWSGRRLALVEAEPEAGSAEPGLVLQSRGGGLAVGTGNGLLAVHRLKPAGGRSMAARDFVRGHPSVVGAVLGQ
jgi:methionyl-tRNA formyltransferase